MADGEVNLKISASSGEAVREIKKLETATQKSAAAAKRLAEEGKKAKEQWKGVQGPAGQLLSGNMGAIGVGAMVGSVLLKSVMSLHEAMKGWRNDQAKAASAFYKETSDKDKDIRAKSSQIKGMDADTAQSILQGPKGATVEDLNAVIELNNKHKFNLSDDDIKSISRQMNELRKAGINVTDFSKNFALELHKGKDLLTARGQAAAKAYYQKDDLSDIDYDKYNQMMERQQTLTTENDYKIRMNQAIRAKMIKEKAYKQLIRYDEQVKNAGGVEYADFNNALRESQIQNQDFFSLKNHYEKIFDPGVSRRSFVEDIPNLVKHKVGSYGLLGESQFPYSSQVLLDRETMIRQGNVVPRTLNEQMSLDNRDAMVAEAIRVAAESLDAKVTPKSVTIVQPQSQDFTKGANK